LANRHIPTPGGCPICNQGPEDIRHLLFQCQPAIELWSSLGLQLVIEEAASADMAGSAMLEHILRREDNSLPGFSDIGLKETVSVACWYLWWLRRRKTHNEQVPPIYRCKISILSITAYAAKAIRPMLATNTEKWRCPEPRQVKLNVDASFFSDSREGATGAVLRDYKGRFIAASTTYLPHVASATMAEAMAMKDGLALALRKGCNSVLAESDSSETIDACNGSESWWSEPAAIYADCIDLSTSIGSVIFSRISREANKAAHDLAKAGFLDKYNCNWDDEPPDSILSSLIHDVTEL
jgi:ribonuclease HI